MGDMKAAFDLLAARPDVDPQRIGIVGWCMGGGYALAFAVAEPRLAAAVVNYGKLVTDPARVAAIHAAVLGNFTSIAASTRRTYGRSPTCSRPTRSMRTSEGLRRREARVHEPRPTGTATNLAFAPRKGMVSPRSLVHAGTWPHFDASSQSPPPRPWPNSGPDPVSPATTSHR